jgi:hypothetical protein
LALVISVVSGDWKVLLRKEVRLVRTIEWKQQRKFF